MLDKRTPMPQTEEYYAALKVKGVPVKLLQFNEEYHGTGSKPSNYIRTQLYMMSWFNKYTRARPAAEFDDRERAAHKSGLPVCGSDPISLSLKHAVADPSIAAVFGRRSASATSM